METHKLKIWPVFFEDIQAGLKNFDIRYNDRDFRLGQNIEFNEYDPSLKRYTNRKIIKKISYIQSNPLFGLKAGWVVLGLK